MKTSPAPVLISKAGFVALSHRPPRSTIVSVSTRTRVRRRPLDAPRSRDFFRRAEPHVNNILLSQLKDPSPNERPVEVVERKGKGHPDTICDALVEEVSQTLVRYYEEHFGFPLHHNVDKALLSAGAAAPVFGGGEVTRPMQIFLAGRAAVEMSGEPIPVSELAVEAARKWLRANMHGLDPTRHVEIIPLFRPGSPELVELFHRQQSLGRVLANDTSCGAGFAPLSDLERVVLGVERELTATHTAEAHPAIGEDVKVMGTRVREQIDLVVACALIGKHVPTLDAYIEVKERVASITLETARRITARPVRVTVNAADDLERGSVYLTVTGTSAESGDDGQAGRGNRVTGLITPYRPMVLESASGKNPISHTGKLYTLAAQLLAEDLVTDVPEITDAHCLLLSQIGEPVESPRLVDIRVRSEEELEGVRPHIERAMGERMEGLTDLWRELASGRLSVHATALPEARSTGNAPTPEDSGPRA